MAHLDSTLQIQLRPPLYTLDISAYSGLPHGKTQLCPVHPDKMQPFPSTWQSPFWKCSSMVNRSLQYGSLPVSYIPLQRAWKSIGGRQKADSEMKCHQFNDTAANGHNLFIIAKYLLHMQIMCHFKDDPPDIFK